MIALLQDARERAFLEASGARPLYPNRPGIRLSFELLKAECVDAQYAPQDPIVGPAWNEFESINLLTEGNTYFEPASAGQFVNNIRPTRAFWLHILAKNGYILP